MLHKTLLVSFLAAFLALVGCSDGDQGDNVTITNEIGGGDPDPDPDPGPGGDCEGFVETSFATCQEVSGGAVGNLTGTIDEDYTLTSDLQWRLSGEVLVGTGNQNISSQAEYDAVLAAGVTLTIEAGTDVRAFDDGSLLVTRGSRLIADGTPTNPITFSSLDSNFDGLGEWGGVVIQGFAPQYGAGGTGACFNPGELWCNVEGEGGTVIGRYGGNVPDDNSGTLRYVRIAEGGLVAGPNNEINGLTLQGVGYGTTLEYIQVHNNLDDGVEWFGGTASIRYVVLTGNDDDDIDFDEGYQGNIQYAIIRKSDNAAPQGSNDPRGIEANSSDDEYVPETDAVLANILVLGGDVNNSAGAQQPGMRLRGALTVSIFNTAVQEWDRGCIRIDDADTDGMGTIVPSVVNLENILNDCAAGIYDGSSRGPADSEVNVTLTPFTVSGTYAINESEAQLPGATTIDAVNNGDSFVFDQTDYIGAVDPTAATGWWEGWIIPDSLESTPPDDSPAFVECFLDAATPNCVVSGTINQDYTFVRGVQWRLSGEVIVGTGNQLIGNQADFDAVVAAGVTLTIEPGVDVRGFDDGSLLVTRGSTLNAVGTAASPITFSSLQDEDFDGLGEWGGVILQGFAPQYGAGGTGACFNPGETWCNVEGEGGTVIGRYGGNVPGDSSGTMRYVRIAEGGLVAGPNNEINGLTMQGVGYGTTIEYIQVHNNLDDGVEWFGGTVNARYLVLTNNDDDDIDFDEGYQGNIQYAIVLKSDNAAPQGSNDPRAIEANSSDDEYVPETEGAIANVLIIGNTVNNAGGGQPGMRLRGALTTRIYNTSVQDFDTRGCVRIDDADTDGMGTIVVSVVELYNVLGDCTAGYYDGSSRGPADVEDNAGDPDGVVTPLTVDAAYALTNPEANVAVPPFTPVANGSGFTFDATDYVGAVEPGTDAADAWWAGWTLPGTL
jgi:hypothetical protein